MNYEIFTVEEENLFCAFNVSSRAALIACIHAALPEFDEPEMREIAENVLKILNGTSDAEFSELAFNPAYFNDEEKTEG